VAVRRELDAIGETAPQIVVNGGLRARRQCNEPHGSLTQPVPQRFRGKAKGLAVSC
jgi:hypothetical protein